MSQTRWLERAVDALDIALLLVSTERKVVFANTAAHRLFGADSGQLIGQGVDRLVSPERRGELRNVDDVLAGGSARKVRSAVRRGDGSRVDVTMVLEPCFDDDLQVSGVSIRYYDAPQSSMRPGAGSKPPLGMSSELPKTPFPTPSTLSSLPSPPVSQLPPTITASPRVSQSRLAPVRAPELQRAQLSKVAKNLQWLHDRLSMPPEVAPLDESRDRARALIVLSESLTAVQEALSALSDEEEIPAAPRMPRL